MRSSTSSNSSSSSTTTTEEEEEEEDRVGSNHTCSVTISHLKVFSGGIEPFGDV